MKTTYIAFKFALKQVRRDSMLVMMLLAPLLAAAAFKYGMPVLDGFIAAQWTGKSILSGYYLLFDSMLSFITPYLVCTISSFLILEERDDGITGYIAVTPVGSSGYLTSRLYLPAGISFVFSIIVLTLFRLTNLSAAAIVSLSLLSSFSAVAISIIVVSAAGNKVEGLALTKLTGITLLGLVAPFFIKGNSQFLFAIFPSFFLAKTALSTNALLFLLYSVGGIICSLAWIFLFYRVFKRKLD